MLLWISIAGYVLGVIIALISNHFMNSEGEMIGILMCCTFVIGIIIGLHFYVLDQSLSEKKELLNNLFNESSEMSTNNIDIIRPDRS